MAEESVSHESYDEKIERHRKEWVEALNVSGDTWEGFDDDIFLMDYWLGPVALDYLVGIDSCYDDGEGEFAIATLAQMIYRSNDDNEAHIALAFQSQRERLQRIWDSGNHPNLNPPAYYIDWALAKGFDVPWLNYAIKKGYYTPKQEKTKREDKKTGIEGGNYVSDKLSLLKQAAAKFWSNADPVDRTTHPDNRLVVAWLCERGYSHSLAESAASIIRPEWAPTGRKPEK